VQEQAMSIGVIVPEMQVFKLPKGDNNTRNQLVSAIISTLKNT
jgi:hypothetical protein